MAHWSEKSRRLEVTPIEVNSLSQLRGLDRAEPAVYLFWFPFPRDNADALGAKQSFANIATNCAQINEASTVCFLTTPPDAASLLSQLEGVLKFQLWAAVKTTPDAYHVKEGSIPSRHASLLILTRYQNTLRHTKTRIQYTYCPACGKTTKDYGGKKHTYHEYGTLLSDVWRDVACDPEIDISDVVLRLSDLFGVEPYRRLWLIDARKCKELLPRKAVETKTASPGIVEGGAVPLESQLVNGDSLEVLRSLPDDSLDFCFADPPYNLKKKYDKWDDSLEAVEYFAWCDKWLTELVRVVKPGRSIAVLNIPLWAVRHYQHLNSVADFQAWIAWDGLGFPVRMIMPAHYAVLCFSKGPPRPLPGLFDTSVAGADSEHLRPLAENYCLRAGCVARRGASGVIDRAGVSDLWHDIHRLKHNSRRVDHPCQLPPELMRRLFALFTKPGEMVLDCFNGAGTSTLVAQQLNRRFIGIELSTQYHETAVMRHEQLSQGFNPFGKASGVPSAKNSPVRRLPKQKYQVSKKKLQLDVKRIAQEIGHLPTREEVRQLSKYPFRLFESYFVSWGEVCAAARTTGMSEDPKNPRTGAGGKKQLSLYALQDDVA